MKRIYFVFIGLLCACFLFAQNKYEGTISFGEARVTQKDNVMKLDMEMDLIFQIKCVLNVVIG